MALESWLVKAKAAFSHGLDVVKSSPRLHPESGKKRRSLGVLAFEVSNLMSRLLQLWRSLSDRNVVILRDEIVSLQGVQKIVSDDEAFLLGLACAEMVENLRIIANSVCRLAEQCDDSSLLCFGGIFREFVDTGRDPNQWVQNGKDMGGLVKRMDRYVASTLNLLRGMDELSVLENSLKKLVSPKLDQHGNSSTQLSSLRTIASVNSSNTDRKRRVYDMKQRIVWKKQEIERFKERSLWNRSFDSVMSVLARSVFTTLARIKFVFGLTPPYANPSSPLQSPPGSAAVHPTTNHETIVPAMKIEDHGCKWFFESNSRLLEPPSTTLGANALSLHYANLVIVMEKMIKSPHLLGTDAREDLYAMLPSSIRSSLRARLKGVVFCASDEALASEWRDALGRMLGWVCPLAHDMIKWQSERSFEQNSGRRNDGDMSEKRKSVFLLQTMFYANKEKTEAAITELLVGLNYLWRYEREMTLKAMLGCNKVFA